MASEHCNPCHWTNTFGSQTTQMCIVLPRTLNNRNLSRITTYKKLTGINRLRGKGRDVTKPAANSRHWRTKRYTPTNRPEILLNRPRLEFAAANNQINPPPLHRGNRNYLVCHLRVHPAVFRLCTLTFVKRVHCKEGLHRIRGKELSFA